jgi:hypothetical protein
MTPDEILKHAADVGRVPRIGENTRFILFQGAERNIEGVFFSAAEAWNYAARCWVNGWCDGKPKHELMYSVETAQEMP